MKTKEEIRKHLFENGYTDEARIKIMGFLIGTGDKKESDTFLVRNGIHIFEHFYSWYYGKEDRFCELINGFAEEIKKEIKENETSKKDDRMTSLLKFFENIIKIS